MATIYDQNSPPVKGSPVSFFMTLVSQANTNIFQKNVTLATGDVKISKDGGAFANVATLPTELGTSGVLSCPLSADEMNADVIIVMFSDIAGSEWQDALIEIRTVTNQLDSAGDSIAADVWSNSTRSLTQSPINVIAAVSGDTINIVKGDTFSGSISSLGALTGYTSLWITIKDDVSLADSSAIIQIKKNAAGSDGLLYINGAAASDPTKGYITINDLANGNITIYLDQTIADVLTVEAGLYYDIQVLNGGVVTTLLSGTCNVVSDVTRSLT